MDAQSRGIVTLLRSGLTGEKLALPEGFDLEQAMEALHKHQIQAVCYFGALNCGVDKRSAVMQKLFQIYCGVLRYNEQQRILLEQLLNAFDEAEVDYMLLKGAEIKELYPNAEMRTMGDADILIRMEQYDRIRPIMEKLGYQQGRESDHELLWQKGSLIAELHKRLIPSNNTDFCAYFGDGWRFAEPLQGTRYAMNRNNAFVYLFTHFAKHYRDGGIGCRQTADLWLCLRHYKLDMVRVENDLNTLGLLEFFHNIQALLRAWFEDGEWDDKTNFISHVVLAAGSWGDRASHILASASKEKSRTGNLFFAKLRRLWKLTFLPHLYMKQKYPVLEKHPYLLPVFWVVRVVKIIFTRGKIVKHSKEFNFISEARMDNFEQGLRYVGLHFDFEE